MEGYSSWWLKIHRLASWTQIQEVKMKEVGGRGVWGVRGMDASICMAESDTHTWNYHTLLIGYTPIQNKKSFKKRNALDLVNQHLIQLAENQQLFSSRSWVFLSYLPTSHSLVSQQVRCPFG